MDAQVKLNASGEAQTIADVLSDFAATLEVDAIPAPVRECARWHMLDAAGVAFASASYEFAQRSLAGLLALGAGDSDVIGLPARLPLRDAVLMNGILVHGLDYDDTSITGRVHPSSFCFPCALGMSAHLHRSGREMLAAYVVGVETAIRIGSVARGGFQRAGFHPTGLVGAFACALIAGRLLELNSAQLTMAQGIAYSTATGPREFGSNDAWTKRMHAGWAGVGGITAALLARQGFVGPRTTYEGEFGVYANFLAALGGDYDPGLAAQRLGSHWEMQQVAFKPLPSCHFNHAFIDACIALAREHDIAPEDIVKVRALVPEAGIKTVCEPQQSRRRPRDSYAAQFSVYYAVACALLRRRFSLADLEPAALNDAEVLALADKVDYQIDPQSNFPRHYSGAVMVTLRDGRELTRREDVNRGSAERPLSETEISAKFLDNAQRIMSAARARRIRAMILQVEESADARELSSALSMLS